MGAPFGSRHTGPRTADAGRELALDLTADEVVLHEGSAGGGWRRFAGVALDDPEFLEVIGLLRAEAEAAVGGSRPVRLWLPAEQVLAVAMPVPATDRESDPEARLRAAFARVGDETGRDPDEVAIALPPAGAAGSTLLVTHADTLHEARDYAARWGFVPGPVSTRYRAEDFAPAEPVFRLRSTAGKRAPAARPAAAWPAIGLACLIGALAPALAPSPADASQAPGQAPLPMARAADAGAGQPPSGMTVGPTVLATLPPPREAGDPDTMSAPPSGPAAPAAAAPPPAAEGEAAEGEAEPGGLAAPLPRARPDRPAGLGAADSTSALPAIGASAPPPVRGAAAEAGLPLDRVSLIGILNLETGREALLRLPDGGFRSVSIGDMLDGWRVSAIGVDAMRVSREAEERTLLLVTR